MLFPYVLYLIDNTNCDKHIFFRSFSLAIQLCVKVRLCIFVLFALLSKMIFFASFLFTYFVCCGYFVRQTNLQTIHLLVVIVSGAIISSLVCKICTTNAQCVCFVCFYDKVVMVVKSSFNLVSVLLLPLFYSIQYIILYVNWVWSLYYAILSIIYFILSIFPFHIRRFFV